MAQKISISPRLTNGYVGTYRHLDKWGAPIIAKKLGGRTIPPRGRSVDFSRGPTHISRVIAPRGHTDRKAFIRALEDEYSAWGCAHSHDCCGCASYNATATHVRGREYLLRVNVSYNY